MRRKSCPGCRGVDPTTCASDMTSTLEASTTVAVSYTSFIRFGGSCAENWHILHIVQQLIGPGRNSNMVGYHRMQPKLEELRHLTNVPARGALTKIHSGVDDGSLVSSASGTSRRGVYVHLPMLPHVVRGIRTRTT